MLLEIRAKLHFCLNLKNIVGLKNEKNVFIELQNGEHEFFKL